MRLHDGGKVHPGIVKAAARADRKMGSTNHEASIEVTKNPRTGVATDNISNRLKDLRGRPYQCHRMISISTLPIRALRVLMLSCPVSLRYKSLKADMVVMAHVHSREVFQMFDLVRRCRVIQPGRWYDGDHQRPFMRVAIVASLASHPKAADN